MLFFNGEMSVGEMMLYHIDFSTVGSMINGDSFMGECCFIMGKYQ